jgi:hypothetical protein
MRKLVMFGAAACFAVMLGANAQAMPLSRAGSANIALEGAMPDQGVTQVWWRGRHHGWYRGHHYGWRHRHWHRYAWR